VLLKDKIKGSEIMDELERQLASGVAFSELAQEHSECYTSAKRGGQLGWLRRGSYFPEFEEAAFRAEVGSPVRVQTPVGLHLILVQESRY
jgi:parvulin-like peptidyl-prolyl isomerase